MSHEVDRVPARAQSKQEAERACRELSEQVERLRELVEMYRLKLGRSFPDGPPEDC